MANTRFENEVLESQVNEVLKSKLEMSQFLTIDNTLAQSAGMTKKVNVYSASGDVEEVAEGKGNTGDITMSYTSKNYDVKTTQGRFTYTDEDLMADPFMVQSGIEALSKEMVNSYNAKAIAALDGATLKTTYTSTPSFDTICDAIALLNVEDVDETGFIALVNPKMKGALRKSLQDNLKYVEDNVRTGYIGTVCGVPVYTSKLVADDTIYIFSKEAVTAFVKKSSEVAQDRDENTRTNYVYARTVNVIALTREDKVVKITKATA